jgi:hypothetical protein
MGMMWTRGMVGSTGLDEMDIEFCCIAGMEVFIGDA